MKIQMLLCAMLLGLLSALSSAQAPVPFASQPLVPDTTVPGGTEFVLTVNGAGFVSSSVVQWNKTPLVTQFISGLQLRATVPAADIATASTANITVVNPAPGGGTSNLAFFTVTPNGGNAVGFRLASSPASAGRDTRAEAAGDFNGDGKLDLAVGDCLGYSVTILMGDGRGNFSRGSSFNVGHWPCSEVVGDFNGDGKLDLAVAASGVDKVSILLGDGTGNFMLVSSADTGSSPQSLAVGDFNRDGKLDLATANYFSNNVSILLGDGTGNFTLAASPAVGGYPLSIAVGDFDGDGKLDLANLNHASSSVSILLGDGTGNFTQASSPYAGDNPISVVVGDFNGDGKADFATTSSFPAYLYVLLGDGTGNFTPVSPVALSGIPYQVTMGDFNGDGNPDLAVADNFDANVSLLLGDGTGNFILASSTHAGSQPTSLAVGDFNGDGKLDLAVGQEGSNTVTILLGIPIGPAVTVSPSGLNFGTQLVGTSSAPQNVMLTSIGSDTVNLNEIAASTNFSQRNDCGSSLMPGASCTITVKFKPSSPGTQGTVTITDNAPNSPQTVMLTGVGTVVTLSPTSLDFGDQIVGTTSAPQTVTLTNHAQRALNISGDGFSGTNPGAFAETHTCGRSLAAGASCTVNVTFGPNGTGIKTATLGVLDDGGGSPQQVLLSGNGVR